MTTITDAHSLLDAIKDTENCSTVENSVIAARMSTPLKTTNPVAMQKLMDNLPPQAKLLDVKDQFAKHAENAGNASEINLQNDFITTPDNIA